MMDFLKKLTVKQATFLVVILFVGVSMFVIGILNLPYIITGKAEDLNEIVAAGEEPDKLDIVEADIQYVLCCYGKSETGYRSIRTVKYHYVVMLEDGRCMSLAVKDEETRSYLSKLMSETKSYMAGYSVQFPEPLHITAVVKGISSQGKDLYLDGINDYGISSDNILMLELDTGKTREGLITALVIGVMLIIAGIAYLKKAAQEKRDKARSFAALESDNNNDPLKVFAARNVEEVTENAPVPPTNSGMNTQASEAGAGTSKFTLKR